MIPRGTRPINHSLYLSRYDIVFQRTCIYFSTQNFTNLTRAITASTKDTCITNIYTIVNNSGRKRTLKPKAYQTAAHLTSADRGKRSSTYFRDHGCSARQVSQLFLTF